MKKSWIIWTFISLSITNYTYKFTSMYVLALMAVCYQNATLIPKYSNLTLNFKSDWIWPALLHRLLFWLTGNSCLKSCDHEVHQFISFLNVTCQESPAIGQSLLSVLLKSNLGSQWLHNFLKSTVFNHDFEHTSLWHWGIFNANKEIVHCLFHGFCNRLHSSNQQGLKTIGLRVSRRGLCPPVPWAISSTFPIHSHSLGPLYCIWWGGHCWPMHCDLF